MGPRSFENPFGYRYADHGGEGLTARTPTQGFRDQGHSDQTLGHTEKLDHVDKSIAAPEQIQVHHCVLRPRPPNQLHVIWRRVKSHAVIAHPHDQPGQMIVHRIPHTRGCNDGGDANEQCEHPGAGQQPFRRDIQSMRPTILPSARFAKCWVREISERRIRQHRWPARILLQRCG